MRALSLTAAAFVAATSFSQAYAAPATEEGAKALADAYAEWLTRDVIDKKIVVVAPKGDAYEVTVDLQKIVDSADAPKGAMTIEPFSYLLTPTGDDAWTVTADKLPTIAYKFAAEKGEASGKVSFGDFKFEADWDGKQATFLRSKLNAASVHSAHHVEGQTVADVEFDQSRLAAETTASKAQDGVDLAMHETLGKLSETIKPAKEAAGPGAQATVTAAGGAGEAAFDDLKAHEISLIWKYLIKHVDDQAQMTPELKGLIAATMPLWQDFRAKGELNDFVIDVTSPVFSAKINLKGFGESVALSGFTNKAHAEIGFRVDTLSATTAMAPPWADGVQPASFDIDVRFDVDGLDEIARLALADPNVFTDKELTKDTQAKILSTFLAGHPRVTIKPGRVKTPTIDVAYQGAFTGGPQHPVGSFTVSADSVDKLQALIQKIGETFPAAQQAQLVLALVKGMAKPGDNGRLVWQVDVHDDNSVTINGAPLPH